MWNEADYIYQQQMEKAYKGVQRAQSKLQGIQYGLGELGSEEFYDSTTGVLVKRMSILQVT